ncbi:phage head-tail connector protein [Paenibacillus paeoniae]|uniref:Phage gp6-like head-tail connector protein n=1 Tax=Paenibacillus paeoniae TaxID=2292705 RepID=A0A371P170_9BACL|nr:phage head-tail connector protein [Paenibacillus paeoniae]REK69338.1 hypothetical protein DX130_24570 [Paenibacillus paeoniae]
MTQLNKLKLMLDIAADDASEDTGLTLLLDDAESDILIWTNRRVLPSALESAQRQVAVIRYNKQGVEGQTSHSEGGISRSFDDLPTGLQNVILGQRLAKLVGYAST